ncbi:MAG: non-canonical purine NTP pyrophosphatase [Candidatus Saccharibacteria bacterium]|nr:non-canonical purine NTP pyrophosphatase [Candidatus Saccharibacteria bacterium]
MRSVRFATGNQRKIEEASSVLAQYGIVINPVSLSIDEIQHTNPIKITEHKVKAAYEALGCPLVVNDSSWEIPALSGFPGGYMKDIAQWLTAEDFLRLMDGRQDRRIILHDVVAYYDGNSVELFAYDQTGVIIEAPRGNGLSMNQVVVMNNGNDLTIAEEFAQRSQGASINPEAYQHWQSFARWFVECC